MDSPSVSREPKMKKVFDGHCIITNRLSDLIVQLNGRLYPYSNESAPQAVRDEPKIESPTAINELLKMQSDINLQIDVLFDIAGRLEL